MFMKNEAKKYSEHFNIICCPCVSPWGYETIQRWSARAVDPNRSFVENSPSDESGAVVELMAKLNLKWTAHFDLHETTNSDYTEFVPARAARDGHRLSNDPVPAGIDFMDCPGITEALKYFELWDKNGDGSLTHNEVKSHMKAHKIQPKLSWANLWKIYDANGDGTIDKKEFC